MSFVNHQMLLLNVFCFRLEPACNNIWTTSPKAVSPIFLRRDPPEAAFTHTSLWSTSTHFHARQRGQWEPSMNSLKPITSLVRHTVLPWAAFSLLCKRPSTILTLAKQRKLPGLQSCEQECCIEWITFEIEPWSVFFAKVTMEVQTALLSTSRSFMVFVQAGLFILNVAKWDAHSLLVASLVLENILTSGM